MQTECTNQQSKTCSSFISLQLIVLTIQLALLLNAKLNHWNVEMEVFRQL